MNDQDCAGLLVEAIQRHIKEPKVIKNACIALASLVEPDGEYFTLNLLYLDRLVMKFAIRITPV